MKRNYLIIICSVIFTFASITFSACGKDDGRSDGRPDKPMPIIMQQRIDYVARKGGSVAGKKTQYLFAGEYTDAVTAVPDEGYEFAYWEDNQNLSVTRNDLVVSGRAYYAVFKRIQLSVKYAAGEHGRVEGATEQIIEYGENAAKVTAIADIGYMFTGWSDGVTQAERCETKVKTDVEATACFGQLMKTYKLDYKLATSNTEQASVTLAYDEVEGASLPVPEREHFTFGGWYFGGEMIAGADGKLKAGNEIFDSAETEIWAKWTADVTYTYKILLVHVTDVDYTYNGVHVKYTMTEDEKQLCRNATILLRQYLNDMLDGLVDFQIDEYFTEQQINNDNFTFLWGSINAAEITEIYNIAYEYQCTISTVDFDYNYLKKHMAGRATLRDGTVYLQAELKFDSASNWLDLNYVRWEGLICTYIHEICHTIEMNIKSYEAIGGCEFHYAISKYENNVNATNREPEVLKLYLLKEILIEGNKVGIPIEYWAGDLELMNKVGWMKSLYLG